MEIFVLFLWLLTMPMVIALLVIDDRIVRHVCLKEGRDYPVFWLFSSYWCWRTFKLSWFKTRGMLAILAGEQCCALCSCAW